MTGNWFRKLHPKRSDMDEKERVQPKKKSKKQQKPKNVVAAGSKSISPTRKIMEPQFLPAYLLMALVAAYAMWTDPGFLVGSFSTGKKNLRFVIYELVSKYVILTAIVNIIRLWEWIWIFKLVVWPSSSWIQQKLVGRMIPVLLAYILASFGSDLYMTGYKGTVWKYCVGKDGSWCGNLIFAVQKSCGDRCPIMTLVRFLGFKKTWFFQENIFRAHVTSSFLVICIVCFLISNIAQLVFLRMCKTRKGTQKKSTTSIKKAEKTPDPNLIKGQAGTHFGDGDNIIGGTDKKEAKCDELQSDPKNQGKCESSPGPKGEKKKRRNRVRLD